MSAWPRKVVNKLALSWFLFVILGCAGTPEVRLPASTAVPANPNPSHGLATEEFFEGITYFRLGAISREVPQAIHVLRIDLTRRGIALVVTAGDSSRDLEYRAQTTSTFLLRNHLQAAVNGGYFRPWSGGSHGGENYYPHEGDPVVVAGLSIHAGAVVSPVKTSPADTINFDKRVNGTLCVAGEAAVSIQRDQFCPQGTSEALAAGPLLLLNGEAQSFEANDPDYANARHPRTAVGLSADRSTAWLVVVDGRQPQLSMGATLQEVIQIFRRLGAADALNLDGGGSSTLVVAEGAGVRLLNSPIHTGIAGRERPTANHLGVRARLIATPPLTHDSPDQ